MLSPDEIRRRYDEVVARVGPGVTVVAATKYVALPDLAALAEAGIPVVGENRAQDLEAKHAEYGDAFRWHFIGSLQSNKAKVVNRICELVHSVDTHSTARRLEVRRLRDGKLLLRTVAAVGAPGAETPHGRGFYVESAFVPSDPFYGTFALETSAYAHVTDWPSDVVGIHGTNRPELLGQAVSHGCIRVANAAAKRLRRLAPLGTPVDVLP